MIEAGRSRAADPAFVTDGRVMVGSPCFATELYPLTPDEVARAGVVRFEPRVVCAPGMTGATSHAGWIADLHLEVAAHVGGGRVRPVIVGGSAARGDAPWTKQRLSAEISTALECRSGLSLADSIMSLRRDPDERVVLVLDAVDGFEDPALRWLLAGVQGLVEQPEICLEAQAQVLVSGAFALETLSGAPDSEYPLPSCLPPEFDARTQGRFLERRLNAVGMTASASAARQLWDYTRGDKLLTQSLAMLSVQSARGRGIGAVGARDMRKARQWFIDASPTDGLFFKHLRTACNFIGRDAGSSSALDFLNGTTTWRDLDLKSRRTLYKAGMVRRVDEENFAVRAPIVADALEARLRRRKSVFEFCRSWGRALPDSTEAAAVKDLLRQAAPSAAGNDLRWLYAGSGEVLYSGLVSVELEGVDGEHLSCEWELRLPPQSKEHDELAVVCACFVAPGPIEVIKTAVARVE